MGVGKLLVCRQLLLSEAGRYAAETTTSLLLGVERCALHSQVSRSGVIRAACERSLTGFRLGSALNAILRHSDALKQVVQVALWGYYLKSTVTLKNLAKNVLPIADLCSGIGDTNPQLIPRLVKGVLATTGNEWRHAGIVRRFEKYT